MPAPRDIDLLFPTGGIDVSWGHDMQPGGTTAAGVNVRAFEAQTQRVRGGSRPGLSRYIDATVAGAHLIQHLNIIVDPTTDALLDDFDPPLLTGEDGGDPSGRDWVQDPSSSGNGVPSGGGSETFTGDASHGGNRNRNPGRRVRRGGSGRQASKHKRQRSSSTAGPIARVGSNTVTFNQLVTTTHTITLSGVQTGDLIVLVIFLYSGGISTVTDTMGNTYSTVIESGFLHMQSAVALAAGTTTITVEASSSAAPGALHVVNLRNVAASPVDGTSSNSGSSATLWTTGSLAVSAAGTYALAAFVDLGFLTSLTFAAGSGFTLRADETWDIIPLRLAIEDRLSLSSPVNASLTVTAAVATSYGAIGATFKAENPSA